MERKISTPLYVTTFILSVAVFAIGVYIGTILDSTNLASLENEVKGLSQRTTSLQLLLLEGDSASFCPVFHSELSDIDADVERIGYELTYLEEKKQAYDPELKRQYFLLEASSYLLSKRVSNVCGDDDVLLLYFYSNTDCESCISQGEEILHARDELAEGNISLKIYSFDGDIGSPVAEAFMSQYGVTEYPSVVVNGETHSGYADSATVAAIARPAQP